MDNKKLVSRLSAKLGKSREDVGKLLDGFTAVVTTVTSEMDSIAIPGFGTFEPVKTEESIKMDPSSGKRCLYPPKIEMVFTASNILKKKLK